ncbi:helix-turn-helix domain-containing protein [Paenibacillus eucommiae]|uniref:AraC-like DNA-binding protein/cell division protein FtsL n=1 Tax=Paenibacillus eucommiae TaxID=1355755 RepID=A0ABS4ILV1_9BACL|nr:helix-turn-helix domain-containing protein [Paenibacillus eucommiae]MBP1988552.1 AraC-like DNA-binding protein/cell division protein FtsL [Paenibacillus eucommiae]
MIRPFAFRWNSLFVKLLIGFLIVIVLLLSFNLLSFTFFKTNIQQEIIDHNALNLTHTVDNYEKQLRLVNSVVLRFYFNERFTSLIKDDKQLNYDTANQLHKEMKLLLSNELFYINNLLVISRDNPQVLEKDGINSSSEMFTKYYVSAYYNTSFWIEQFKENYPFRVFPASPFQEIKYDKGILDKGNLMPFIVRNKYNPQYIIVALIDAEQMRQAFLLNGKGEDRFFILDESGQTMYRTPPESSQTELDDNGSKHADEIRDEAIMKLNPFPANEGFFTKNNQYYFYKKGSHSSLTYVTVIPNVRIASQVAQLNQVLIVILAVSLVLSVSISILLSMKINNPIQTMVRLVQKAGHHGKLPSKIHEFNLISTNITDIIRANHKFHLDLNDKNSLLKDYGYINKIKNIYPNNHTDDLIETNKPYYLVVFQLAFTDKYHSLMEEEQEKASFYIKEFITLHVKEGFTESVTFQMEEEQILSLIFTGENEGSYGDCGHGGCGEFGEMSGIGESGGFGRNEGVGDSAGFGAHGGVSDSAGFGTNGGVGNIAGFGAHGDSRRFAGNGGNVEDAMAVMSCMRQLKQILDHDKEYSFLTIAFHPAPHHATEISAAYKHTQAMLRQRLLNADTQIITELQSEKRPLWLPAIQEQELLTCLQAGCGDKAMEPIARFLHHMEQKKATADQFRGFGKEVMVKVVKSLLAYNIDFSPLLNTHSPYTRMEAFTSREEYEQFFRQIVNETAELIRANMLEKDPIKDFVLEYIAEHYGEDISLELLADKLNLSRGYLSSYFHENTGTTFSDYLNRIRIRHAKEMLNQTDGRIQDVALQVGYQNVNSFIRMFKRICGLTPGEYRKLSLQERGDVGMDEPLLG